MHMTKIDKMLKVTEAEARKLLQEKFEGVSPYYLSYFSWPQLFGNTAGPFSYPGRISGAAMTTFQMECWTDSKYAVVFTQGKVVHVMECEEIFTIEWYTSQRRFYG